MPWLKTIIKELELHDDAHYFYFLSVLRDSDISDSDKKEILKATIVNDDITSDLAAVAIDDIIDKFGKFGLDDSKFDEYQKEQQKKKQEMIRRRKLSEISLNKISDSSVYSTSTLKIDAPEFIPSTMYHFSSESTEPPPTHAELPITFDEFYSNDVFDPFSTDQQDDVDFTELIQSDVLTSHGFQVLSPLELLSEIFSNYGIHSQRLQEVLHSVNYDLDSAVNVLFNVSKDVVDQESQGPTKKRQVCRHFLAGSCFRKDCWFSHDLEAKTCMFWLKGECLKGLDCPFLHGVDVSKVEELSKLPDSSSSTVNPIIRLDDDEAFPSLGGTPKQSRKQSSDATFSSAADPTPLSMSFRDVLNMSRLFQLLPHVDPTIIRSTFIQRNYSMEDTSDDLRRRFPRPTGSQSAEQNAKMSATSSISSSTRQINHLYQIAKTHAPTAFLSTGSSVADMFQRYRSEAAQHAVIRNAYFQRSAEAYRNGDKALAKDLSLQGKLYNEKMIHLHNEASERIFKVRRKEIAEKLNLSQSSDEIITDFIDLHGLFINEALGFLESKINQLYDDAYNDHHSRYLFILTGTGHHSSNGRAKLLPAIKAYLKEYELVFVDASKDKKEGMLLVQINSME
ncbi:hypothetical protein BKA69DRAFT_1097107 [Paraphysoderma sedebokerense]|nr:hypothetical protein BKA69DRAFT_1097107 [Paraphysoderma sedebokerense]